MSNDKKTNSHISDWLYKPYFYSGWPRQSLYSLAEWKNGMAFRNIDFSPNGRPVIKIAEIKNGITRQTKFTDSEYNQDYYIRAGDMLFSWSGQPETSIDVFWWHGQDGWLNQHIFKVLPRESLVTRRFLFYLIKYLKPQLVAIAKNKQTTGLGHVAKEDMKKIMVGIPPLIEQQVITNILGVLDDRIELNRRMNETLEGIARAIFKSWFIDFDPVRAKAEGRDPGLPKPIADLFPDELTESELGMVPRGWEIRTLDDVIELAYGKALKESERIAGDIPVYGSNGQVGWHNKRLATGPGIIVGRKGNPGVITWSHTDFFPIDTTFYVVTKIEWISLRFMFYALQYQNLPSLAADSAVPGLNRNLVLENMQLIPSREVVSLFDQITAAIFKMQRSHESENRYLSSIRDTLLPKLISGQLRIKDAERFLDKETA